MADELVLENVCYRNKVNEDIYRCFEYNPLQLPCTNKRASDA